MIDIREIQEKAMRNIITISEDDFAVACAKVLDEMSEKDVSAALVLTGAMVMAEVQHKVFHSDEEGR